MSITGYAIGGLLLTILIMSGIGKWYYSDSQATIAQLNKDVATERSNVSVLKGQIKVVNDSVRRLEATRKEDQNTILKLSEDAHKARRETGDLRKTFAKHDLNNLSLRKPGLIEKIINRGTKKVHRDLEKLTQPLKESVQ